MNRGERISLVIPCRDEERAIGIVLKAVPSMVDEIIVVDNRSTDGTAEVASEFGARVVSESEIGYGYACRRGLLNAGGDLVILMDGDNNHSACDVARLASHLQERPFDFVSGSRFPLRDKTRMFPVNQWANHFISGLIRKCFGIPLVDSQSGMVAFRRSLLPLILPANAGMGFSQEIKLNAWLHPGIRCSEIHIAYQPRLGQAKFRAFEDSLKNLGDLFAYWCRTALPGAGRKV